MVRRLQPELEEIFARHGIDLEEIERNESAFPMSSPLEATELHQAPRNKTKGRGKIASILYYVMGFKELRGYEKLMVMAAVDAYARGSIYQARVKIIGAQVSCKRATVFRALKKLAPKWLEKISRPGKPNILKPSPILLKCLGLSPQRHGDARAEDLRLLAKGMMRCRWITGMSRRSRRS
jgi:hypothetical protein